MSTQVGSAIARSMRFARLATRIVRPWPLLIPRAFVRPAWRSFASDKPVVEAEVVNDAKDDGKDETNWGKFDEEFKEKQTVRDDVAESKPEKRGPSASHAFQAETSRILEIVTHSLYTDKEVFLRELISNASDALEKARYLKSTGTDLVESERPPEIRIYTDPDQKTITIQDYGVGMDEEELVSNLGTIARSGSKKFITEAISDKSPGDLSSIIGQFGVGFYASFMVANKLEVFSRSALASKLDQGHCWSSDGFGHYEVYAADNVAVGTKIVVHLKDDQAKFANEWEAKGIIKKYSNFVGFPIYLNNAKLNTISAIWTKPKESVSEEEHTEFYRFIANAFDTPRSRLHFQTDAPLNINALFYIPERHMERFGMGRQDPGVNLYSRKVLIKPKSSEILPEWLRFIKGVVDSEDIPLNISRENMQDSMLVQKINRTLTKRVIKHLDDMAKKDTEKYNDLWNEFGAFMKEGVCRDFTHKDEIGKLLRFDSSLEGKTHTSLDDYISRMPPEQSVIYYLNAPNRQFALNSPYYETFQTKGTEVLFLYNTIDDFVMSNLGTYQKRKLENVESANVNLSSEAEKEEERKRHENADVKRKEEELLSYFKTVLSDRVATVKVTTRLKTTPAIVVGHDSAAVRKMMQYVDQQTGGSSMEKLPKQKLEINPNHPIMEKILTLKDTQPDLTKLVAEQVFDNALIAADLLDSPRSMLGRLTDIMERALGK